MAEVMSFLCFAMLVLLPFAFFYFFFRFSTVIPEVGQRRIQLISSVILGAHLVISSFLFFCFLIWLGTSSITKVGASFDEQPLVCSSAVLHHLTISSEDTSSSKLQCLHCLSRSDPANHSMLMEWSSSGEDRRSFFACGVAERVGGLETVSKSDSTEHEHMLAGLSGFHYSKICFKGGGAHIIGGDPVCVSKMSIMQKGWWYNAEKRGKRQVMIRPSSKVMQKHGYIGEFEYVDDHKSGKIVVELNRTVDSTSAEFDVGVPPKKFGYTSAGIMDHEEARRKNVGGKVLGFLY